MSQGESCLSAQKIVNRDDWVEAVQALRPYVLALAASVLRDPNQAQDVAQDVITRALQTTKPPRDPRAFKAWLRTTTVRVALDYRSKIAETTDDQSSEDKPGQQQDPTTHLAVHQTLASLDPAHRAVLALAYGEQLSYAEIAETLHIPIGTVASRLSSAKSAFKSLWLDSEPKKSKETSSHD